MLVSCWWTLICLCFHVLVLYSFIFLYLHDCSVYGYGRRQIYKCIAFVWVNTMEILFIYILWMETYKIVQSSSPMHAKYFIFLFNFILVSSMQANKHPHTHTHTHTNTNELITFWSINSLKYNFNYTFDSMLQLYWHRAVYIHINLYFF